MSTMAPHQFIISKANSLTRRVNFQFSNVHGGSEMYSRVFGIRSKTKLFSRHLLEDIKALEDAWG